MQICNAMDVLSTYTTKYGMNAKKLNCIKQRAPMKYYIMQSKIVHETYTLPFYQTILVLYNIIAHKFFYQTKLSKWIEENNWVDFFFQK